MGHHWLHLDRSAVKVCELYFRSGLLFSNLNKMSFWNTLIQKSVFWQWKQIPFRGTCAMFRLQQNHCVRPAKFVSPTRASKSPFHTLQAGHKIWYYQQIEEVLLISTGHVSSRICVWIIENPGRKDAHTLAWRVYLGSCPDFRDFGYQVFGLPEHTYIDHTKIGHSIINLQLAKDQTFYFKETAIQRPDILSQGHSTAPKSNILSKDTACQELPKRETSATARYWFQLRCGSDKHFTSRNLICQC